MGNLAFQFGSYVFGFLEGLKDIFIVFFAGETFCHRLKLKATDKESLMSQLFIKLFFKKMCIKSIVNNNLTPMLDLKINFWYLNYNYNIHLSIL